MVRRHIGRARTGIRRRVKYVWVPWRGLDAMSSNSTSFFNLAAASPVTVTDGDVTLVRCVGAITGILTGGTPTPLADLPAVTMGIIVSGEVAAVTGYPNPLFNANADWMYWKGNAEEGSAFRSTGAMAQGGTNGGSPYAGTTYFQNAFDLTVKRKLPPGVNSVELVVDNNSTTQGYNYWTAGRLLFRLGI